MIPYIIIYAIIGFMLNSIWIYQNRKNIFQSPFTVKDLLCFLWLFTIAILLWPLFLFILYVPELMKKQLW